MCRTRMGDACVIPKLFWEGESISSLRSNLYVRGAWGEAPLTHASSPKKSGSDGGRRSGAPPHHGTLLIKSGWPEGRSPSARVYRMSMPPSPPPSPTQRTPRSETNRADDTRPNNVYLRLQLGRGRDQSRKTGVARIVVWALCEHVLVECGV